MVTITIAPQILDIIKLILSVGFFGLLIVLLWIVKTMPIAGWILRKAGRAGKGTLTIMADDYGKLRFDVMSSHIGQGILLGDELGYTFTPRPTYEIPKQAKLEIDASGQPKVKIEKLNLSEDDKNAIDEMNAKKCHMVGISIPVLIGYQGKSVAASTGVLDYIEQVYGKTVKEVQELNLLDPRKFKEYIKWNFSPAIIRSLCLVHEAIGRGEKEDQGGVSKKGVILVIVAVIAGLVLWQSGLLESFMGKK